MINIIAFYLAELRVNSELLPAPASCAWVFPLLGAQHKIDQYVTFLVGDRISLADICVFCTLFHLFENLLDAAERANYISLTRWFNTILNQPQVKAVNPKFQLCTKPLEFDPAKYAEFVAKTGDHGGDREEGQKKKQEKQPKQEKKEQPKKEKEPEPVEELDAVEAALLEEPKSKDPFDSLPNPSTRTAGVCELCVRSWVMGLGGDFDELLQVLEFDDLDEVEVGEDEFAETPLTPARVFGLSLRCIKSELTTLDWQIRPDNWAFFDAPKNKNLPSKMPSFEDKSVKYSKELPKPIQFFEEIIKNHG
uniref:Uncharacterized protein n=1 Tax=Phlebotomus papatasi TaxID=29031 RepID=A0A1B0D313_PHLPP